MEVYKDSSVDKDEFDFENILPYFKDPVARTRSKYETLMDPLSEKIQYLPADQKKIEKTLIFIVFSYYFPKTHNHLQKFRWKIHRIPHMYLFI